MSITADPLTILLATDDVLVRALMGRDLRSAGYDVWETSRRSALEAVRWYGDTLACLVIEPEPSVAGPGLHAILDFRFLHPMAAICCLVDDDTHRAVEHVPGVVPVRKSARHAPDIVVAVQESLHDRAVRKPMLVAG